MTLIPLSRDAALVLGWHLSDPVPVLQRPERPPRSAGAVVGHDELQALLCAIPNRGHDELDYDEWWRVVAGIHEVTSGSDAGLELAHTFSAKSSKYAPAFLDERVWPFIRSEGRGQVVGLGSLQRIAARYGWQAVPVDADVFDDVSELDPRPPMAGSGGSAPDSGGSAPDSGGVDLTSIAAVNATALSSAVLVSRATVNAPVRRGIPEAHHLTTDQANANRIVRAFGRQVFVAAGRWHVWDGRRWLADESDVYRYGCQLSDLIRVEAIEVKARASVLDAAEQKKAAGIAEALMKWAVRSEMKATIESAIGLARKMLTVEADMLDRDPFALNCLNGVVDLRTGALRRHNPDELITKLVPVAYRSDAVCPGWDTALSAICQGNDALVGFLQRWAGYCLTGSVEEQCFVVHWGGGANGKSTVLGVLADTMGDYAGTAAPGLLAATKGGDRHPTEIASLMGRRMVTAHESGEGVVLREDFIKQATGGDRMEARFMRGDFFGFSPTHKLQLLTNHKPQVKGQDRGIWRRVLLVPYGASFGDAEAVRVGKASALADVGLAERLKGAEELEGVLAWRVRGCVAWVTGGGLRPPAVVMAASEAYKAEQDRVGQFVSECCERAPAAVLRGVSLGPVGGRELVAAGWAEPLTDGMGGLYPAYTAWCKESGIWPLSKTRFADDVLRVAGAGDLVTHYSSVENGKRRKLTYAPGLRMLDDA